MPVETADEFEFMDRQQLKAAARKLKQLVSTEYIQVMKAHTAALDKHTRALDAKCQSEEKTRQQKMYHGIMRELSR